MYMAALSQNIWGLHLHCWFVTGIACGLDSGTGIANCKSLRSEAAYKCVAEKLHEPDLASSQPKSHEPAGTGPCPGASPEGHVGCAGAGSGRAGGRRRGRQQAPACHASLLPTIQMLRRVSSRANVWWSHECGKRAAFRWPAKTMSLPAMCKVCRRATHDRGQHGYLLSCTPF